MKKILFLILVMCGTVFPQTQQISTYGTFIKPQNDGNVYSIKAEIVKDFGNFKVIPYITAGKANKLYRNQYGNTAGYGISARYYLSKIFFADAGLNKHRFTIADVANEKITEKGYRKDILQPIVGGGAWFQVRDNNSYLIRGFYGFKGKQDSRVYGKGFVKDNGVTTAGVEFTGYYRFSKKFGFLGKVAVVNYRFTQNTGQSAGKHSFLDIPVSAGIFYEFGGKKVNQASEATEISEPNPYLTICKGFRPSLHSICKLSWKLNIKPIEYVIAYNPLKF